MSDVLPGSRGRSSPVVMPTDDNDTSADANSSRNLDHTFTVVSFVSIALYNVLELTFIIFATFKKRSGLYFWGFCVATWGIPPYSIAFLLKGLDVNPALVYLYVTLIVVGWICTVSGQSVVLYSRLHLVDRNSHHLAFVRAMILVNGIVLHSVTTVMVFGANSSNDRSRFVRPYSIVEKVQVTIFFIQELIISGLYVFATAKFLRDSVLHAKSARARILRHLMLVNVVVILLDITILALEYADLYQLQTAYKGMAYSIKLKLEFNILNELVLLTQSHPDSGSSHPTNYYIHDDSQQAHTFMNLPSEPTASDNAHARGNGLCLPGTLWSAWTRGRGRANVEAEGSTCVSAACGNRGARNEGITVTRTIDVDVVRQEEFERQLREMGRMESRT